MVITFVDLTPCLCQQEKKPQKAAVCRTAYEILILYSLPWNIEKQQSL